MKQQKIKSKSDPNNPRPWYKLDVTDGSLEVTITEENGLVPYRKMMKVRRDVPLSSQQATGLATKMSNRKGKKHKFALSTDKRSDLDPSPEAERPELANEIHVLAVSLEGDLEFVPFSRQRAEYYAHLAWYDPKTEEWSVLEFEEEGFIPGNNSYP